MQGDERSNLSREHDCDTVVDLHALWADLARFCLVKKTRVASIIQKIKAPCRARLAFHAPC